MKWRVVLCLASLQLAMGMHLLEKSFGSEPETNCIEYPYIDHSEIGRVYETGWSSLKPVIRKRSSVMPVELINGEQSINNRMDHIMNNIIPGSDNLITEHAKLVQDINSLRQAVFIVPFIGDSKDYDDSIFHEIIETTSTTTSRPIISSSRYAASSNRFQMGSTWAPVISSRQPIGSTKTPVLSMKPLMSSSKESPIPIILLGGASQRQIVKSHPITFAKPTISLIGTSVSPLMKHPYPFVMQSTTPRLPPVKICMKALSSMYSVPKQPSLWDRLFNLILPSRILGR